MTQLEISLPVRGKSFNKKLDSARLWSLRRRIWETMRDGQWRTLSDIHELIGLPVGCDIPRRLREMRDIGYQLFKERTTINGVWIYKAVKK